jgi:hypothetical protein
MGSGKGKSLLVRITTIIFSLAILVIPGGFLLLGGLVTLFSTIFPKSGADIGGNFFTPLVLGGVFFFGGVMAIYRNIKNN